MLALDKYETWTIIIQVGMILFAMWVLFEIGEAVLDRVRSKRRNGR